MKLSDPEIKSEGRLFHCLALFPNRNLSTLGQEHSLCTDVVTAVPVVFKAQRVSAATEVRELVCRFNLYCVPSGA